MPKLEDARRSMTLRELMTHTGGLGARIVYIVYTRSV